MKYNLIPYPLNITEKSGIFNKRLGFISKKDHTLYNTIEQFFPAKNCESLIIMQHNNLLAAEEYILYINSTGVEIHARDAKGHFYGAITLLQLIAQFGCELPCLTITDKPKTLHRAVQINYGQANVEFRHEWLSYFIKKIAFYKINHLYLYFEWNFSFECIPQLNSKHYPQQRDIKRIVAEAKKYNITIVPQFNLLGHSKDFLALEQFAEFNETAFHGSEQKSASICPSQKDVLRLMDKLVSEICETFDSPIIHVGGDEVDALGLCPLCKPKKDEMGRLGIYLEYFTYINKLLLSRGRKMGLWSDMLLMLQPNSAFWKNRDVEEQFRQQNIEKLKAITSNLVIYDWWYFGVSKESINFFTEYGIEVVATSSTMGCYCSTMNPEQTENIYKLFKYAQQFNCAGTLVSDWINYGGYHSQHMLMLFIAGGAIGWSGAGEQFSVNQTKHEFNLAFEQLEYKTHNEFIDFINFAGTENSELLNFYPPKQRGLALRKYAFHYDNPLTFYIKARSFFIKDTFAQYSLRVTKLVKMWENLKPHLKSKYDYFICLPVVVHKSLSQIYALMDKAYASYHLAAKIQFANRPQFKKHLKDCIANLKGCLQIYRGVFDYTKKEYELLGNDYSSLIRIRALLSNLKMLIGFIGSLKKSQRSLPSFEVIERTLFTNPSVSEWNELELDWLHKNKKYRRHNYYNNRSAFIEEVECFNIHCDV